jgi:hypothetical protein
MTKFKVFLKNLIKQVTVEKKFEAEPEALMYHRLPRPGKFTIKTTKPMNN